MLLAKACQAVGHFKHSPTACEKLKNPVYFTFISVYAKSLATCARCWNKVEVNLPYAEKTIKLKASVQNYVANIKFKPENIPTADEWKFVSLFNELLEPFLHSNAEV